MRDPDDRRSRAEPMPFLLLLPNLVTMAGMCLGLTALRFAFAGRFEAAAVLILLAAAIDGLDGLIARRLRATSNFGAELDSLADFLNFGVVPGLLIYEFTLGTKGEGLGAGFGWVLALVYVSCACLRLARFNVARAAPPTGGKPFFTGVPSPAGAILALLPLFADRAGILDATAQPVISALWLGLVGALMISRIPTFSPKSLRVEQGRVGLVLVGTAILVGMLFTRFWLTMVVIDLVYAAMILQTVVRRRGRDLG
ncbi:MAG: phosphatidylcholine/phosphatidylserine synthase [Phaeovulum sp.]|uniref:CDP-alcohol phosphatidyltransferase family protein n=1 Tax=Phaeovulum sp. TaxID=2934796 RepID=UPI002733A1BF|nr:phosphatidylcholine/phosphatidylserine synthase [Phaeovulum sp.]MDP3862170.1 phosphatidylcholine/phosphatidylserine synthase [Phaeovulum sp.]